MSHHDSARDSTGPRVGIDVGSVNVKVVLRDSSGGGLAAVCVPGRGRPLEALEKAIEGIAPGLSGAERVRIGVTGGGEALLPDTLPASRVNEVVAAALGVGEVASARTVIDLGGHYSKWILLGEGPRRSGTVIDFATNGLCAAGCGAFVEQQAGRLNLSVESLGDVAAAASRSASIAGRCSVFAKSDMIHLQQRGTPVDEVALGLCFALARTFASTVMDGRRPLPPLVLVGGGAANPGLVRAFRETLGLDGEDLVVPENPLTVSAIGAAVAAADAPPVDIAELLAAVSSRGVEACAPNPATRDRLPPLTAPSDCGQTRLDEDPPRVDGTVEAYLGIDVGSVSTNLVLLDPGMTVLQGVYLPTRGRPMEVLDEGLRLIEEKYGGRLKVLGVGTTGSGRHLAAEVVGADVVHNEITAQMVSAAHFVPDVDTIFEIGGQDSKYVHVRDGKLADFEMNKICAAGTGSFLEEQADQLGIEIRGEFERLALGAECPCDLGTRCTVFMDSELARARDHGASVPDLCAGLAYSVSRNYLEKLVAGRRIGDRIVFQGGTASNAAVVAAFRRLLNRPVVVHPYNRISGAIGVAILASRAKEAERYETRFAGLDACAKVDLKTFECHRCENLCRVNRVEVSDRVVHFGDACERYSERDRASDSGDRPFPELFAEREALLESFLERATSGTGRNRGEPLGLLRASLNLEHLPLWAAFVAKLGFRPVIAGKTSPRLLETYAGAVPADVCLPIKVAAAQARSLLASGEVERLFLPAVLEFPGRAEDREAVACLYNQELADMVRADLGDRVVAAQFALQDGVLGLIDPALALARELARSVDEVARALSEARTLQADFERARRKAGAAALAAEFDRAVVVLGKPYNTHDAFANLGLARLLDRMGLLAIPWDLLPLDGVTLDERWQPVPWHYNREQLRAVEIVRRDGRLFPVLVSSYGCGPDGFVLKHLEELLANTPRLLLEFDEHRGEAGLLTRLEAFADEIDAHVSDRMSPRAFRSLTPGASRVPKGRRFFIPNFTEYARIYAAGLRSEGFEAEVLPPVDDETIRIGEEQSSGRECHPYAILAGEMCRLAEREDLGDDDVFLCPTCATSCLLRQYGDGFRIIGERLGLRLEIWDAATRELRRIIGVGGTVRIHEGFLATDVLVTLARRLRPYVRDRDRLQRAFEDGIDRLADGVTRRRDLGPVLAAAAFSIWSLPRDGEPGDRPVVGVTGDLYTRICPVGNAGLFERLEGMGCEVWPSPSFAAMTELSAAMRARQGLPRVQIKEAFGQGLTWAITSRVRRRLVRGLDETTREAAVEPTAERFLDLGVRYVGPRTSALVFHSVGKIADFLARGADGVISASAVNCMVGTAISAAVPRIRADHAGAPVVTLVYGGVEGPSQRLRLETFVHQVLERRARGAA